MPSSRSCDICNEGVRRTLPRQLCSSVIIMNDAAQRSIGVVGLGKMGGFRVIGFDKQPAEGSLELAGLLQIENLNRPCQAFAHVNRRFGRTRTYPIFPVLRVVPGLTASKRLPQGGDEVAGKADVLDVQGLRLR